MSRWHREADGWAAEAADAAVMRALGQVLGTRLRAGDLVILDGPLGAGKTTFTQGIAQGLGVRGPITSPTFVIARRHPPAARVDGPSLVHLDAYRLADGGELDDLDLDADVGESVTVVEWGAGKSEGLAPGRLIVTIERSSALAEVAADEADESRRLSVRGVGERWTDLDLGSTAPTGQPPRESPARLDL